MAMPVLVALISIGGKVVELLVEPVGRQFGYVFHRVKYIEDLRYQVKKLEAQRKDIDDFIDAAKRNGEEILETVKIWIEKVDGFIVEAKKLLEAGTNVNQKCFNGWFPDLVTRRQLAKEAKNKAEEAKQLEKNGYFSNISKPAPPLGMESVPSERLVTYETTNLAMMNVMQALHDDKINFVGIHGIGGVGKTTLVKEIGKKAKSDKLFDEVVMAVVSQNADIKKIQDQIAGMLGFTKFTNQMSEIERTSALCARLKNVKKILVILDDVWDRLELTTLGIPFGQDHEGCKIIITTRREQVCRTMGNEWEKTKIVWLDVLSEQDSWDLFRKNVGDVVASSALNAVAKEVCKECGGLPISVVTVAKAMKGESNLEEWKNAAQELKKSSPTNIEDVNKKVYQILMWSYDYLQDEKAKACFLLCSLFPEDDDILVEDLVRYGMGLRLFKNVDTVQEVRGRAKSVISNLIDSCLLLASDEQDCIKMHGVVRDVAIFIGSKKHFVRASCNLKDWPNMDRLDQYTGISLMRNQISNLPEVLECPKLQILLLQYNGNEWSCSHEFFSRMKALSVLDLSQQLDYYFPNPIRSPDAFNNQTCLRTLVLDGIKFGDTKFLGQLKTLEVLSLRHAFFSEAPNAIRELTNLRLLDMTESRHEFPIPATMVLPLFHLEELYLFGITSSRSIGYPEVEVVAALRSLPLLKMLTISIPDIAYIPKDFVFPELENFIVFIGKSRHQVMVEDYSPNYLNLANLVGSMVNWSKWLKMVLNRATHLTIEDCSQFKYLIDTEEWGISSQAQPRDLQLLFNLEELKLSRLDTFEGICAASALTSSSWVCFPKLRILTVRECPELSTVLLPFNLLQGLQHLEKLRVGDCKKLEQIFDFGSEGEGMKLLSSLRDLYLFKLPRLKHILNCSSRQHVEFCNLRSMIVESCGKLKYVFQPSIAQALHQLEELWVYKCEEMEEIVAVKQNEGQQEEEERVDYKMVFKSLKFIHLDCLPNLSGFCIGGDDFPFEWPSLEFLTVRECPKMKTFAATTSGSTPKLKEVEVGNFKKIPLQGMDLNQFVQTHIISKPPKFVPYNLAMTMLMEALSDDNIYFIGIHGIGGVGKTTLVKEIGKKAKSDKLFDEVVMAVVSQNQDIEKIQDDIAGMLGFTSLINQRSKTEREGMLCERLKDVKKILVILDDVWDKLDLAAVGIPFGNDHQGCKIIITTRREQVCNSMGMERLRTKIVHLGVLSEEDSWDLFKKNVGDVLDSNVLNVVANKVCKECGGLPIALVTVGSAMKGKDDPTLWDEAARELRKSMPTNIEGVDQHVYKCLKLSYDYLQDEEAKACFLLCSLFPEDHNILIEDLVRYGMGLRIFKKVDTVHEARGRAKSVTVNLIASCLLLASDNKQDCIKMHDVVRDVAIDIGSKKHFVRAGCNLKNWPNMYSLDQYTAISLMRNQISNLPQVLECPKLQILLLQDNKNAWSCSHEFFSRMNALSVLDLSQQLDYDFDNPIRSPYAFNNQMCLRTLVLDGIKFEDTKFLGQFKTVELLSLRHAFFSEAPNAISELTNLRLLDMTESHHEFLIPIATVSPLSHLEELYLLGTKYSRRIGDPAVEVAAALRSWPRLKVLTISIPDIAYVPKDSVFSELESFIIFIGKSSFRGRVENYSPNYLEVENLVGPMVNWSKWLKMVLKRATHLRIEDCSEFEYLINTEEWGISSQAQPSDLQLLFNLKELELSSLDTFKGICAAGELTTASWACFPKLRSLEVYNCPSLSTVLLPFNLLQRLQHLEKLSVTGCVKLELVFDFGSEGEGMKLLSSLRDLRLEYLPRLKHILNCSSRQEEKVDYKMEFKSLKQLYLVDLPNLSGFCTGGDCPKMKTFAATTSGTTPKLNQVRLDESEIPLQGMGLNQFVQNHFKAA